jgi:hypothetical protein
VMMHKYFIQILKPAKGSQRAMPLLSHSQPFPFLPACLLFHQVIRKQIFTVLIS